MTRKPAARLRPVIWSWCSQRARSPRYRVASASPSPTTRPPTNVIGNDRKLPSSAAARPATVTTIVSVRPDRPVSGATSTAARPASAPPSPHVIVARRSGDQPSVCTARSFSALALMASPVRVYRVHAHRPTVTATEMTTR